MEVKELVEKIKKANRDYYLEGMSELSDQEYDALVAELREKDPNNNILLKVGDDSEAENKVQLPNIMGSQNKVRPTDGEIQKLYSGYLMTLMPKLDGISKQIEYEDGKFKRLLTRGNGFIGQDITARAKYMNFPKEVPMKGMSYIFGEAVVTRLNFKQAKGSYKHPRNFVGGTLRPILTNKEYEKVDEAIKFNCGLIDIVAFNAKYVGDDQVTSFSAKLDFLKSKCKFKTVDHVLLDCKDLTPDFMDSKIKEFRSYYPYLTDGIIVRIDNIPLFTKMGLEANDLNPKGSRAVKADLEKQFSQIGTIKEVEWNISKRGIFVPRVILTEALNFDGAEVDKINGVNAEYVQQNGWVPGARVKVIRSGDVIPRIIATDSNQEAVIPQECPYCHSKLVFDTVLYCPNDSCQGRTRESFIKFFTSLDMEDVSSETISNLYDKGYNTYEDLLNIKYEDLIRMEGYQATKAVKVHKEIKGCLKNITLAKLMYISQVFMNERTSLGETKLQWVIDAYGEENILASLNGEKDEAGNFKKLDPAVLASISGFGDASIALFTSNYINFKKLYLRLKEYVSFKAPEVVGDKLKGMIFTFTQFRDKDLEDIITRNGGQVKGISKKTTALFTAGASTKTTTAEKYGVPIIAAPKAREYIMNLLK